MTTVLGTLASAFPAEVSITDLTGEIETHLDIQSRLPSSPMVQTRQVADSFLFAANAGMFSYNPTAVAFPSVRKILFEVPSQGLMRVAWTGWGIQPGAYRILLNMLEVIHLYQTPFASLYLRSSLSKGNQLDRHAIMTSSYPKRIQPVYFDLRFNPEELVDIKELIIRMEFSREILDEEFDELEALFKTWDFLITRGGYGNEFDEVELDTSIVFGETYMASPDTLEHTVGGIIGAAEAFDALINMAVRLHATFCPLVSLES